MRFSRSTHLLMLLSLGTLTSIIKIGWPILVELTLLRWLTFPLGSQTVILTVLLFWIYFSSDAIICSTMVFPLLRNSDHVVDSVSIDISNIFSMGCPVSSHSLSLFSCWLERSPRSFKRCSMGGSLNSMVLLLLANFVSEFRLELMYSLIESIRSSLTHIMVFSCLCCCHSSQKSLLWFVPKG